MGNSGFNGGNIKFIAKNKDLSSKIIVDTRISLDLTLKQYFNYGNNSEHSNVTIKINLSSDSKLKFTVN